MEARTIETPVESRGDGQTSPPRPPERRRRFQIIKLEERIAPVSNKTRGAFCGSERKFTCG
jgi:hypothetical protein